VKKAAVFLCLQIIFSAFLLCLSVVDFKAEEKNAGLIARKIKLIVVPVQMAVEVKGLKEIGKSPESPLEPAEEQKLIGKKITEIENRVTKSLIAKLAESGRFEVSASGDDTRAVCFGSRSKFLKTLPVEKVMKPERESQPDFVIVCRISGYGKVKKGWTYLLVGSGFAEGVVHGVIALKATASGFLAIGAALGEAATEALKWGGGSYLFGKRFSPVILETAVYEASSGKRICTNRAFAVSKKKYFKDSSEDQKKDRDHRLDVVREKAVSAVAAKLEKDIIKIEQKAKQSCFQLPRFGI
jgi:hypothetical protein